MRRASHVTLPDVITEPGEYVTRCGEIVTITAVVRWWATGTYSNGVLDTWDKSGRLLPFVLSNNDIVARHSPNGG